MPDPVQTPDAPAERASFVDLSTKITGAYEDLLGARREREQALTKKAEAIAPKLTAAQTALETRATEGAPRAAAVEAAKPEITAPPSRHLTEFLAPVQGESPETSVLKMIQGLGLLAGSIGGLARGDARGALAGLKGALAGWSEGDAARADRAFRDWQAKTAAALEKWQIEREGYQDWLSASNLSLDMMLKGAELEAIKHDNTLAAQAFRSGTHEIALKYLTEAQKHEDAVALRAAQLEESRTRHEQMYELKKREVQLKEEEKRLLLRTLDAGASGGAVDPVLDALAEQWNAGTPLTELVRGIGPIATARAIAIQSIGIRKAREQGNDPMERVLASRALQANTQALRSLSVREAQFRAYLRSFELTVANAKALSDKVARTTVPAWNRRQLEYQSNVLGNEDAKNLLAQFQVLSREVDRVLARAAGTGSDTSREEAKILVDPGMTQRQFDSLVENVLSKDALYAVQGFEDERSRLEGAIRGGSPKPAKLPEGLPDPAANKDKIARDTQTGKRYRSTGTTWELLP